MSMSAQRRYVFAVITVASAMGFALLALPAWGAGQNMDLDGRTANGAESANSLTVVTSYPVKIKNKITNKAIGDSFSSLWVSAGPGGWGTSIPAGTSTGVGAIWTWETVQQVFAFTGTACNNDLCFTKIAGPDPVTTRGPFRAPGRSLTSSSVTVSNASLTSSLITFFSPPKVLASATTSVAQLGTGGFAYTTTVTNTSNAPITIDIAPGPPGCCPDIHQKNCDGTCVYYLTDPENCGSCGYACAAGEFCSEGECVTSCPEPQKACGGTCVDTDTDPANCGGCGVVCAENQICSLGGCKSCRPPLQTSCDGQCVNIHTDAENCGGCGINCNFLCPSTGHGVCSQGQSCHCVEGFVDVPETDEAPLCEFPSTTQTIPAGGTFQTCQTRPLFAKEIVSKFTVCGADIPDGPGTCSTSDPATFGPLNILVPDMTQPLTGVALTANHFELIDTTLDRVLQPNETATVKLSLLNVGPDTLTGVNAVLSSPPVDLTDDGIANPAPVTIGVGTSAYPNIVGVGPGSTDCSAAPPALAPSTNSTPFSITIPSTHPGDVGRPFNLAVTGTVQGTGEPFQANVPLVLGIGSNCVPAVNDGSFDKVIGLANPMAALVLPGDTIPYPSKAFQQGKTRPMKLQMLCAGTNLDPNKVTPPEIVGLSRNGVPLDITILNLNDDNANPNDPFFRFPNSGSTWNYNMRTRDLATGIYVITIRLGGDRDMVAGFVLN